VIGKWNPFIFGVLLSERKRNIQQGFSGTARAEEFSGIKKAGVQAGLLDERGRVRRPDQAKFISTAL
jgi:hypothetical protein